MESLSASNAFAEEEHLLATAQNGAGMHARKASTANNKHSVTTASAPIARPTTTTTTTTTTTMSSSSHQEKEAKIQAYLQRQQSTRKKPSMLQNLLGWWLTVALRALALVWACVPESGKQAIADFITNRRDIL